MAMDMVASAIGGAVTPKHHSKWGIGGFLQDMACPSQTFPNTGVVLSAKSFEILGGFRVGCAKLHRTVGQGDNYHLPHERMFNHIGQCDSRAEVFHIGRGQIIGYSIRAFGDLGRNETKAQPSLFAHILDQHFLQIDDLPRGHVDGQSWRRQRKNQRGWQGGAGESRA